MNKLLIIIVFMLLASCTVWRVARITQEIVEEYPEDNAGEEFFEECAEDYLDMKRGSLDFSFWNDDGDWIIPSE